MELRRVVALYGRLRPSIVVKRAIFPFKAKLFGSDYPMASTWPVCPWHVILAKCSDRTTLDSALLNSPSPGHLWQQPPSLTSFFSFFFIFFDCVFILFPLNSFGFCFSCYSCLIFVFISQFKKKRLYHLIYFHSYHSSSVFPGRFCHLRSHHLFLPFDELFFHLRHHHFLSLC